MQDFGRIVAHFRGHATAASAAQWDREVALVWDSVATTVLGQAGFLSTKTFWNQDDSGDVVMLAYWNSLAERLAYERAASGGVRASMETTLREVPVRLKYELVGATGVPLGKLQAGVSAGILSGRGKAASAGALAEEADRLQSAANAAQRPAGHLGTHVLFSTDGQCTVQVLNFWRDAAALNAAWPTREPHEALLVPGFERQRYVIVRST